MSRQTLVCKHPLAFVKFQTEEKENFKNTYQIIAFFKHLLKQMGFLGGSVVKKLPANAGDVGVIPGSGRSPGEGNGNPLQYSCLGNSMDRGA